MKTKRLSINLITSFACKVISLLLSFVVRKLIIDYLGKEYLGLNSLFTDLLSFLNLADLGLGVVIQTCLYAHFVNFDEGRIRGVLNFTSKLFKTIALIVVLVGALLLPFIQYFIKDTTFDINFLRIVFSIEVLGIAITYMATSEQILLEVEEKKYILNFIELGVLIVSYTVRILAVVYWKNYYIYASAILIKNLITIAIVTIISRRKYSSLFSKDKIDKEDKKYIKRNLFDLIPMRLANFLYSSTDSVIISSLIGISVLAVFSNYNLIFASVLSFILMSIEIIKIPFGKMFEEKNPNIEKYIFSYFLFQFFLSSICAICLLNLTDDFITLFFGEGLLLEKYILIIFVVDFFIHSIYQPFSMVILSKGLFKTEKWITLIVEGVNVVVSVLLVLWIGVCGAIIGTLLSNTISLFIRIHRVGFRFFEQKRRLIILFVSFFALVSLEGCLSYYLVSYLSISYINLFLKLLISVSIPIVINLLIFFKTKEFEVIKNKAISLIKRN